MAQEWKSLKGQAGIQFRTYASGEKTYRFKQQIGKEVLIDYLGAMEETEVLKIVAELRANRKNNFGAQTYKELQAEEAREEKAAYIKKTEENKQIIAQDNFNKQNSLSYFFDEIYWPYRSAYGNPKSNKNITSTFNLYWRNSLGHVPITEIKYTEVDKVLQYVKSLGRSEKTIKEVYGVLQAVYNYAKIYFSAHYSIALPEFCGKILKLKKPDNEKVCWLTADEAHALLKALYEWPAINGTRDVYGMAILALYSGLRFGDIVKLRWRDVEGDIAYAHATKSGASYGVHLNIQPIQDMLEERKGFFPKRKPEEYIFLNKYGEIFKTPPKLFERTVKKLGLNETPRRKGDKYERITFHSLRHTFASWLALEGVDLYVIRALMGHNDIKMTQRYAKLSKEYTEKHVMQLSSYYRRQNAIDV